MVIGFFIISTGLCALYGKQIIRVGGLLLLLAILAVPAWHAFLAALLTIRDVTQPHYELLMLTTISNRALVRSYFHSTLHRASATIVYVIGAVPALLSVLVLIFLLAAQFASPDAETKAFIRDTFELCIFILMSLLGLWGMNRWSVALGVLMGLGLRRDLLGTLVAVLASMASLATVVYIAFGWPAPAGLGGCCAGSDCAG